MIDSLSPSSQSGPRYQFSVLMLGQGFGGDFVGYALAGWNQVKTIPPFDVVTAFDSSKVSIGLYADAVARDFGLRQTGTRLEIGEAARDKLHDYLAASQVRGSTPAANALDVWPEEGRTGRFGSLVVVLVKGDRPGELYQLTPTPRHRVPLVAVVTAGEHWPNVIARGIAQAWACLSDEFELPGQAGASVQLIEPRPNLIVVDLEQRSDLNAGRRAQDVVKFPPGWSVPRDARIEFHPHVGSAPDRSTTRRANGRLQLVEGGAGYVSNVLRCDFDCLMRREPYATDLPIQAAGVQFCRACAGTLRAQGNGPRVSDLRRRPRVLLDSQRPLCDAVRWAKTSATDARGQAPFAFAVGAQPEWSCQAAIDPALGLRLSDIRLKNRPGDPFAAVEQIFKAIEFRDLKVKFAGEAARALSPAVALANTVTPARLAVLRDGASRGFLGALRLTLTWHIPGRWSVEAVMSVVFKDSNNDFDPGGAAIGNKLFPQLSLRYRRPPKETTGALPRVESLAGAIRLVTANVFPTGLPVHADFHHMLTGTQQATFTTDTNTTDHDSEYSWNKHFIAEWLGETCLDEDVPEWGLWGASWKRGRLLADVREAHVSPLGQEESTRGLTGATARKGHLIRNLPGLPHWSLLFDHVTPLSRGTKRCVAVYRDGDRTPAGNNGGIQRFSNVKWPRPADQVGHSTVLGIPRDYEMLVHKFGRQGAFDNVHVHPAMGHGAHEVVPAPFCGELCIHLHWRWGIVASNIQLPGKPGFEDRPQFLGWGRTGRLDQGAGTAPGAPLVPPNQHVEVAVDLGPPCVIDYEVSAHDPDFDAFQVVMEQGTGVLWSYGGIDLMNFVQLLAAVGVIDPRTMQAQLQKLQAYAPEVADRMIRVLIHEVYQRIRFYDPSVPAVVHESTAGLAHPVKAGLQQVPGDGGAPDLEGM